MTTSQKLRDICIQDPRRETAYFLTSSDLHDYEVDAAAAASDQPYVTFALTDESLIDAMPDINPLTSAEPNVLIHDLDSDTHYMIRFSELKKFEIDRPSDHPVAKTYTIPMPEALVEELPSAVRALLQTDFHSDSGNGPVLRDSK
ncbi:hypothetical protein [Amycolatopsis cihanbeyliensis]|uniref:Uncharacterized protein n=1 Tax=Amycolatopsis cihanbeyliensis TaxID=1128664 RepID=A0A542DNV5_AMYCI|nr:hypothetical protein [Amycolatopsis cihanbeyliensis]TQJ04654.1 hypothetical protein FB471_4457 [Amycolatopsis cihanbeyliensis]